MDRKLKRRSFFQVSAAGSAFAAGASSLIGNQSFARSSGPLSPGSRNSNVKIAKVYMAKPEPHWPTPTLDLNEEVQRYEREFSLLKDDLAGVDFTVNELITSTEQIQNLSSKIKEAEGLLIVKLSIHTSDLFQAFLALDVPTVVFAEPYSGHEWTRYGQVMKDKEGAPFDCLLTSDYSQLAAAVRPIRAIHHLREAKILNVTSRDLPTEFVQSMRSKFGTQIEKIDRERMLSEYNDIPDRAAQSEAKRWIAEAERVVEPSEDEIFRSCKLALAMEKLLEEEGATVMTVDCYGSMFHQLPAFPCIGFTRLNDMGWGGICESDLRCAVTHILFQGLVGKPGFISDPTMDMSKDSAILAHCLGSTRMDGPSGERAPYKIRTIMERREGAVPQVRMRIGQKVTQALLVDQDFMLYFIGDTTDAPDTERGCRTKITVHIDGDAEKVWKNWSHGLHRVTCYGDLTKDLERFCRFKKIELVNEA